MLSYYFSLSWLSLKKTPILSALMALAVAVGIASCLTILTMYSVISRNPMAHKNETIAAIQLNSWGNEEGYPDNDGIPVSITYKDALALYQSGIADQLVLNFPSGVRVEPIKEGEQASSRETRLVTRDFFSMFDVSFKSGSVWSEADDASGENVVVLSEQLSSQIFGEQDPVGQNINLSNVGYTVVGVVSSQWNLTPSVYDLLGNAFREAPQLYIPFFNVKKRNYPIWGNISGWMPENIQTQEDFLSSELIWIYAWAGFSSPENKAEFRRYLRAYVDEQHNLGRYQVFQDVYLRTPQEWLDIFNVVTEDDVLLLWFSFAFLGVCLMNSVVLLLAKFSRHAPEAGVRRALGANKASIFLQHLAESILISCIGAMAGLGLSALGLKAVKGLYNNFEVVANFSSATVLFAVVLAIFSGVVSGLIPAYKISQTEPARYLKAD